MERTMQEKEELEMDHCEETEVHEELLRIVQEKLPKEEELYDLAELYNCLLYTSPSPRDTR